MRNNKIGLGETAESEKCEILKHNARKGNIEKVKGEHETYVEITKRHNRKFTESEKSPRTN